MVKIWNNMCIVNCAAWLQRLRESRWLSFQQLASAYNMILSNSFIIDKFCGWQLITLIIFLIITQRPTAFFCGYHFTQNLQKILTFASACTSNYSWNFWRELRPCFCKGHCQTYWHSTQHIGILGGVILRCLYRQRNITPPKIPMYYLNITIINFTVVED